MRICAGFHSAAVLPSTWGVSLATLPPESILFLYFPPRACPSSLESRGGDLTDGSFQACRHVSVTLQLDNAMWLCSLRTSLVLLMQTPQHLPSLSILLVQQTPVPSSPGRNTVPFLPSERKPWLGPAEQDLRWQRESWHGRKALGGQIGTGQETHERHWRKPGPLRAGATAGSGWGSGGLQGGQGTLPCLQGTRPQVCPQMQLLTAASFLLHTQKSISVHDT